MSKIINAELIAEYGANPGSCQWLKQAECMLDKEEVCASHEALRARAVEALFTLRKIYYETKDGLAEIWLKEYDKAWFDLHKSERSPASCECDGPCDWYCD